MLLGAGLDTFAQRRPEIASRLQVFELDQPGPQAWKRQHLIELGHGIPAWLRLVPADFEAGASWWERLLSAGFDGGRAAVVAAAGVSMYLTREANAATLRQLAPGSTLAMTFQPDARRRRARVSGTPFISFFAPEEMLTLARNAGVKYARHVAAAELSSRYFAGIRRWSGEDLLVASV